MLETRKLSLRREILADLTPEDLRRVAGAEAGTVGAICQGLTLTTCPSCPTCLTCVDSCWCGE